MKTETLNLNTSRGATTAHVARANNDTKAAVILIQEYWGINDHIRDIAGRYAKEGYLCVAPDLYRGKVAKDSDEASKLMQELAIDDGMETIRQAITEAKRAYGAQKLGITGYCMGGTFALRAACEIPELAAAALDAVSRGRHFFSGAIGEVLLEDYMRQLKQKGLNDSYELLTDREKEVLQLLAEGKSNKEVAAVIDVSPLTVETHRSNLMQKLNLHSTAEIVLYAVRKKIIA